MNHFNRSGMLARSSAVTGSGVKRRVMVRSVSPSGVSSNRRYWSVISAQIVPAGEGCQTSPPENGTRAEMRPSGLLKSSRSTGSRGGSSVSTGWYAASCMTSAQRNPSPRIGTGE